MPVHPRPSSTETMTVSNLRMEPLRGRYFVMYLPFFESFRTVGKSEACPPSLFNLDGGGGHASLCPPYSALIRYRRRPRGAAVRIPPHSAASRGLRSKFRPAGARRRSRPPRAIRLPRRQTRR